MVIDLSRFSVSCACGRTHTVTAKSVLIESGAILKLPEVIRECGLEGMKPCIVCDENTYKAAGELVCKVLPVHNLVVLKAEGLHPDEHAIDAINAGYGDSEYIISVGSGTLNDLGKYVANEHGVPTLSVATAASMDGFVSTVAAMTLNNFKVTKIVPAPIAVIADTDIFSKAPYRLTASGIGDIIGKYTALSDWRISHVVRGEYLCENIFEIEYSAVVKVAENIDAIRAGDKAAYEDLMYALILSGLAMQMNGNSRPASGAEHHLSHFWELNIINDSHSGLHGEMVGVGLQCVTKVYKDFMAQVEDPAALLHPYQGLPHEDLKRVLGFMYEDAIKESTPDDMFNVTPEKIIAAWPQVREIVAAMPSHEEIMDMLRRAGAPMTMEEVGVDSKHLPDCFRFSPFIRGRITLIRLLNTMFDWKF